MSSILNASDEFSAVSKKGKIRADRNGQFNQVSSDISMILTTTNLTSMAIKIGQHKNVTIFSLLHFLRRAH